MAAAGSDEQGEYDDRYGGFTVPTTMRPGLLQIGTEGDPTTGRTMGVPMQSPMVELVARTDKDHSTSVSGGFTVSRRPETVAAAASRAAIEKVSLRATSLFGLAYATEELLTDSPMSFVAIIDSGFREQFAAHMLNEKLRGGGGNEYLGVLNSPAKVAVAAEAAQAADTILAQNVINMRARAWGYGSAIWLANHDTYPQLITMAVIVGDAYGAGGIVMVYKSSSQEDRPDMLLGRPIFYSEYASKLGDEGDISLVNWSQYLEGLYQPIQSAESVHVRFVNHERAFKFWLRNAGAPWWRSPLTPAESTQTLSPIVTLAAR
jgi:HK97 family phage major capsid protein